ncbi:MAG: CDP-diacylglycerol--glycerol-3-phosphate 3-phosphatidyltransferase [Fusobacteriota bacterium]
MNLPNKLTLTRFFLIIPFAISLKLELTLIAFIIFVIASLTDFIDGYIARRDNLITDFGKLMDPLADKVLVISALIIFVELQYIPSWILIIIITREFLVTGIRIIAASKGDVIAASKAGKYKTTSQMLVILAILFTKTTMYSMFLMMIPLFFTIWSGYEYVINSRKYFK